MDVVEPAAVEVRRKDRGGKRVGHGDVLASSNSLIGHDRVLYMDVLRVLAGLSVVMIHASGDVLNAAGVRSTEWRIADVLNTMTRWSVPIFFMVSGALLLGYRTRYSTNTFFSKRLTKVLVPFVAWSAIYLAWRAYVGDVHLHSVTDVISNTLSSPAMYHLWFFYVLLGLYLVTPILAVFAGQASRRLFLFLVGLCVLNSMALPLVPLYTNISLSMVGVPLTGGYLGYFLLGWLAKDASPSAVGKVFLYSSAAVSVVFIAIGTYRFSTAKGSTDLTLMQFDLLPVFVLSLAAFFLIKSLPWNWILRGQASRRILGALANATFGIYLIHVLVKYYFHYLTAPVLPTVSVAYLAIATPAIYIVSALIVMGLQRVPVLAALVP